MKFKHAKFPCFGAMQSDFIVDRAKHHTQQYQQNFLNQPHGVRDAVSDGPIPSCHP